MGHGLRLWLPTLVGLAIIGMTLRDVVHELFHPEKVGSLSRLLARGVWRALHAIAGQRRRVLFSAGPLTLITVALVWAALLILGWALVYWPRLLQGFNPNPALTYEASRGFGAALYVSMGTMTTLSASDITPVSTAMRWAVTLESFIGPMLFTAWITWVLGSYPVLAERRALAHEVAILRRVHGAPRPIARYILLPEREAVARGRGAAPVDARAGRRGGRRVRGARRAPPWRGASRGGVRPARLHRRAVSRPERRATRDGDAPDGRRPAAGRGGRSSEWEPRMTSRRSRCASPSRY